MPPASGTPPGVWAARTLTLAVVIVTALNAVLIASLHDRGPLRRSTEGDEKAFAQTEATPVVVASSSVAPTAATPGTPRPPFSPPFSPPPPRPPAPPEPVAASAAVPLSGRERALLESLDPDLFAALPPRAGAWEAGAHPPCFAEEKAHSAARRCLPDYHVVGAWQSGGQAFNAKLGAHPDVREGAKPHFWNEPAKKVEQYLDLFAARAREADGVSGNGDGAEKEESLRVGDASPGVLANTWTESRRMHRAFEKSVAACWQACQTLSDDAPDAASGGDARTPRRRCVDGDVESDGCIFRAAARDAVVNGSAAATSLLSTPLSVPHLMRHAYGEKAVKIIALVRSPLARLRAAFAHYAHYAERFGEGEAGFDAFVETFAEAFERCEKDALGRRRAANLKPAFSTRTECAFHFEALGPVHEKVFYHCDQLIKTMYGTFARGWVEAFGAANVLVLRTEDAFSDDAIVRKRALNRAVRFLGLRVPPDDVVARMDACDEANACVRDGDMKLAKLDFGDGVAATRAATRRRVDAFFEPETTILAELFGDHDEASSWAAWGRGEVEGTESSR